MKLDKQFIKNIIGSFLGSCLFALIAFFLGLFELPIPFKSTKINLLFLATYFLLFGWTIFVWVAKRESTIEPIRKFSKYSKKFKIITTLPVLLFTLIVVYSLINLGSIPDAKQNEPSEAHININKIELLEKTIGEFPHNDEYLYTFILSGTLKIKNPENYSLIGFYKNLDHPDQRYGWYCIESLDSSGWDHPNAIRVDELDPKAWEYVTSRIYLEKNFDPRLAFILFILPNDSNYLRGLHLTRRHNGYGWDDLEFLKKVQGSVYSKIRNFHSK